LSFSAEVIDEYPSPEEEEGKEREGVRQTFSARLLGFNSGQHGRYATLMTEADIAARIERFVSLSAGFGKEIATLTNQRLDPSLRREAQDYLAAIRSAQNAVDRAWIVLVKLKQIVFSSIESSNVFPSDRYSAGRRLQTTIY
jgi:hypothetical protein